MTVSMARALGLGRLAVPTQGNAGDALAEMAAFDATTLVSRFVLEHTSPAIPRRSTSRLLERIAHQGAKSRSRPLHHSPRAGGSVEYLGRLYLTGGTTGPLGRPK